MFNKLSKIFIVSVLGIFFVLPSSVNAGRNEGGDMNFSVSPSTSTAAKDVAVPLTFTARITIYGQEFRNYCGVNTRKATWEVYQLLSSGGGVPSSFDIQVATQTVDIPNQTQNFQQTYSTSASVRGLTTDGSRKLYAELKCGLGGADLGPGGTKLMTRSSILTVTGASSGQSSPSPTTPGSPGFFSFEIPNPLRGGADDFSELVTVIAQWIFNLAIPIAVAMIVYSGILFLTAQGEPGKVTKAKDVLKWAVIGLAIILIGSGFITLIQSILELGSTPATNTGFPSPSGSTQPQPGAGAVGNSCSADRDCSSSLKCRNAICQRQNGNNLNEACVGGTNCASGLICDSTSEHIQIIDGRSLGSCVNR